MLYSFDHTFELFAGVSEDRVFLAPVKLEANATFTTVNVSWYNVGSLIDRSYVLKCVLPEEDCDADGQGTNVTGSLRKTKGWYEGTVTKLTPGTEYWCYVIVEGKVRGKCSKPVAVTTLKPNTCDNFNPDQGVCAGIAQCSDDCNADGDGLCFTTTDGYSICDRIRLCGDLSDCITSNDCPDDYTCELSCCDVSGDTGICVPLADSCPQNLFAISADANSLSLPNTAKGYETSAGPLP